MPAAGKPIEQSHPSDGYLSPVDWLHDMFDSCGRIPWRGVQDNKQLNALRQAAMWLLAYHGSIEGLDASLIENKSERTLLRIVEGLACAGANTDVVSFLHSFEDSGRPRLSLECLPA